MDPDELWKILSDTDEQISQAEELEGTEKEIKLRQLRLYKRNVEKELQNLTFLKIKGEVDEEERNKQLAIENQKRLDAEKEIQIVDNLTLAQDDTKKYNRSLKMCTIIKKHIMDSKDNFMDLIDGDTKYMVEAEKEKRKLELKACLETAKDFLTTYKKHNEIITSLCNFGDVDAHMRSLAEVILTTNNLKALLDQDEDRLKKKIALQKSEQLEGLKIEKFSGLGETRFLKYFTFYTEFKELVLEKEYSDSTKLRFLKQYTEGDANRLINNFHKGEELLTAFKILDDHYGKSNMVIRECLRNIKKLEQVRNENNIRANKNLINSINTNVSTLKCYGFELEGNEMENSTFLIEMEQKLPHDTYIKWEEEKSRLKRSNQTINIQGFIDFYTERIQREEN